ncbi:hypothetical protein HanHA300_Chr11g0416781 [Helianthus annuus]|nr:hypothetical protein HanHA300_Chr11g0416781 [Helianthus annuus]KAJ0686766.1 hypothetical protein HanLR1_Chr11g0418431 [Helianthus annuus]
MTKKQTNHGQEASGGKYVYGYNYLSQLSSRLNGLLQHIEQKHLSKAKKKATGTEMCTLWKIWNSRIEKIFEGGANSLTKMNSRNEKIFEGGSNSQQKLTEAIKETSKWKQLHWEKLESKIWADYFWVELFFSTVE